MTTRTRRVLIATGVALGLGFVICAGGVSYFLYTDLSSGEHEVWSFQRQDAIGCALDWARAASLPEAAQIVSVTTAGSMFTREFRVTFVAPAAEVEEWLQRSPGAREAVVTVPSAGVRHFRITPGGGSALAEVTVDDTQRLVVIHAYWS